MLTQGHVQRTDTTTYRRGQRTLDRDNVVLHCIQGFFGQPGVLVVNLSGLLACVDFHPGDFALATVSFFYGSIDDLDHDRGNIEADAITFDVGDDRVIRNVQGMVGINGNFVAAGRHLDLLVSHL